MKREHHRIYNHHPSNHSGGGVTSSSSSGAASMAGCVDGTEKDRDASGMDELLAVLGYKVRSSEMAEVAQKLEQLEEVIGSSAAANEDDISEIVHYDPSDLSNWLDTMLSELNPPLSDFNPLLDDPYFTPAESSTTMTSQIFEDSSNFDYDLKVIPGKAIYSVQLDQSSSTNSKRFKTDAPRSSGTSIWGNPIPAPPVSLPSDSPSRPSLLILDSQQESGIRLVHTLTICAQAIQQENLNMAEVLVKQIEFLATTQVGAMGKVAAYFAKALALRIDGGFSPPKNPLDSLLYDNLQMHFYDTCPYLKFAHFTANQAILEAFAGKSRVHVIDFSLKQGMQWPALMHAFAVRPGGPPSFRLTGIGSSSEIADQVGWKLAQFAKTMNVDFQYRGFAAKSSADLDPSKLDLLPGESIAVNSIFDLHTSLAVEGEIDKVLASLREMEPDIVTIVEQEANHNGPSFSDRFNESLHYYSALFDSLETASANGDGRVLSEAYLGRQICNVVACEGTERVERHEPLVRWRERFNSAGFSPRHIGSNAFRQASLLLQVFAGGDGYGVEEREGCLLLGWHARPLIATSAWQLGRRRGVFGV